MLFTVAYIFDFRKSVTEYWLRRTLKCWNREGLELLTSREAGI
jgi:hypothetical protein